MRYFVRLAALIAAALLVGGLPAQADQTMEMAKKEGKVVWYSSISLAIAQELCNTFNAKKLGIECVLHRDGSGKLYRRWIQEAKSNIYAADILHTSDIGHFVTLRREGALVPYLPEVAKKYNPAFVEKDGNWLVLRASVYAACYNTKKVTASEAPTSWKDFLDPKWKGKMVNAHPGYSGFVSLGLAALVKEFGWDYLDKLAANQPRIVQSAVDTTTYVVRGEALICSGGGLYNHFGAIKKGEPIKAIIPKEGAPFVASAQAIMKNGPHPNAARVFTDWLFSLEAQQILAKRGLYSGHPDVVYPKGLVPLKEVKLMVVDPEDAMKMDKPIDEAFRRKFGV
ncbi:MAG: extracellular solute-binding protein [Candidatus Lambdaproteobacteria bacterium]|nr:extracellular solute-binding protein [Candidatus Lambdaproteobacteria bacterium]